MNNTPLFSICIPTFNRPELLSVLLDRILVQIGTRQDVEIVIATNNSNDEPTRTMLIPYLEKYAFIHYHKNPDVYRFHNTVQTTRYATGEYIISLADDDAITDYAISYLTEIVEKTQFDILFHKPVFAESIDIPVTMLPNEFSLFQWINEYLVYLHEHEKQYKHLISFFSFQSAFVVKASYWHDALAHIDRTPYVHNEFPHEFPEYFDLKEKIIVVPHSTLGIGRILNESYPWSTALIEDLHEVMDYIEQQNDLSANTTRKELKKICINGWTRMIYLWIWIRKLGLDYKKNPILKALYYFYKKYIQ